MYLTLLDALLCRSVYGDNSPTPLQHAHLQLFIAKMYKYANRTAILLWEVGWLSAITRCPILRGAWVSQLRATPRVRVWQGNTPCKGRSKAVRRLFLSFQGERWWWGLPRNTQGVPWDDWFLGPLSIIRHFFCKFVAKYSCGLERKRINCLKVVLAEKGMTNKQLSELLDKDPAVISKWVTNAAQQ